MTSLYPTHSQKVLISNGKEKLSGIVVVVVYIVGLVVIIN